MIEEIYTPLAARLGFGNIKWQLEDLLFKYRQPKEYFALAKAIGQARLAREQVVNHMVKQLRQVIGPGSAEICRESTG